MKVSKAQAQANRAHIVETASALFRERGYEGIGVADLMAAAGFTHGGFYKHFASKADLAAEATACGIAQTVAQVGGIDAPEFVRRYVSRAHRDTRTVGCTMAALGGDAARQPEAVRAAFADGIEGVLAALEREDAAATDGGPDQARAKRLDMLAHALGAIVMSRACPDDSPLADEILATCRATLLASLDPGLETDTRGAA
ncbi:TetR/AcrR family transcriptional regulator [Xanthomonas sp. NCPPB 2654]|uniref:TetR/AcrR family transcriptional regulator n=1 Tax=unclassified Xanthomonas TaxID=2643310 RepID=UPI0021E0180C|nr:MULTISPECIES: TetR/AcrR family transcriptional regulator [unclassified Xanthomonas]MDL5366723.1 TetR/AcrR family transcriptional regulator [Xanthomonas sp. NCPPB 2654]UYC19774.1 TetR/AcrR family transcriptional regulator [Xanthomonas sp. CFBP 8443]